MSRTAVVSNSVTKLSVHEVRFGKEAASHGAYNSLYIYALL